MLDNSINVGLLAGFSFQHSVMRMYLKDQFDIKLTSVSLNVFDLCLLFLENILSGFT